MPPRIRRKCFVSYHSDDVEAVDRFIKHFGPRNFIKRGIVLSQEVVKSDNTEYVLRRIRTLYIRDSTVTIVLLGPCTWSRRFVDWELQASLQRPANGFPNGVIGIRLYPDTRPRLPPRLQLNRDSRYARIHSYPATVATLEEWIEDAYQARTTRAALIANPRARWRNNRACR